MWFIADRGARPAPARVAVPAVVPVTIAAAWAVLLVAELAGAPMSHDALAGGSLPLGTAFGIFAVAWVAMVLAMMLPSSYPLVRAFTATVADLPDRAARLAPFLVG
jgi:predicted metal-binding membrane protein